MIVTKINKTDEIKENEHYTLHWIGGLGSVSLEVKILKVIVGKKEKTFEFLPNITVHFIEKGKRKHKAVCFTTDFAITEGWNESEPEHLTEGETITDYDSEKFFNEFNMAISNKNLIYLQMVDF